MSRPDGWGWGVLSVEQRGQRILQHLAGWIGRPYDVADILMAAGRHMDRELVRLHGAADQDRAWLWTPGLGDGFVKP